MSIIRYRITYIKGNGNLDERIEEIKKLAINIIQKENLKFLSFGNVYDTILYCSGFITIELFCKKGDLKMERCSRCGFPLNARPNTKSENGVCLACINNDKKIAINFESRQKWLTEFIQSNKTNQQYDCLVAVSGGKDSHMIVRRLYENHGVKNALLVSVTDEFTHTEAGKHNINNLVTRYNCDHITFRCQPKTFIEETIKDFEKELHPLKWIEEKIYKIPVEIAKAYNIKLVFYGENSAFEYGTDETLEIFHPASDENTKIIFMGAIYPYSISDSLACAREIGFKDLDDFNEWPRKGSLEQSTQIDSIAYIIQLWTKFVKFGFQRVTDIATRFVREGILTRDEAMKLIIDQDGICDPQAKKDFYTTLGKDENWFDEIVNNHANKNLVKKDDHKIWRLIND